LLPESRTVVDEFQSPVDVCVLVVRNRRRTSALEQNLLLERRCAQGVKGGIGTVVEGEGDLRQVEMGERAGGLNSQIQLWCIQ
jgi:hypothetical protein